MDRNPEGASLTRGSRSEQNDCARAVEAMRSPEVAVTPTHQARRIILNSFLSLMRSEAGELPHELSGSCRNLRPKWVAHAQVAEGQAAEVPRGGAWVGAQGQVVGRQSFYWTLALDGRDRRGSRLDCQLKRNTAR